MIDFLATRTHFADHLRPVWEALAPSLRGRFLTTGEHGGAPYVITAAYEDYVRARKLGYRRQAFLEHGIGQSYVGVRSSSYAGGRDRLGTELFLVPNETCAARWRVAYPDARVELVGLVKSLPIREGNDGPVVAVSSHWNCLVAPETMSGFNWIQPALPALAERYKVIGHGHPRAMEMMSRVYRKMGIEVVADFDEVCRRADVYVCDNSSSIYEFASTGRPVVVLNPPFYRWTVNHGLRFWEAASVGIGVADPAGLLPAVDAALGDPPEQQRDREAALNLVYQPRTNGPAYAATALSDWVASHAVAGWEWAEFSHQGERFLVDSAR